MDNIDKLEAKVKALQAKARETKKKAKEQRMKAELERLKEFEKQVLAIDELEQIQLKVRCWNEINDVVEKYGLKMSDVAVILEAFVSQRLSSTNNQV